MSEMLLLKLLDSSSSAPDGDWLLWDSAQQCVTARGELKDGVASEELKSHSRSTACMVLVPGELVTQLSVTLPIAGASAEAALPFQVEERLSCELERVHIAHEKIRAGQPCTVWVVDKSHMDEWLDWIQASGLRVSALLPDYAVLAAPAVFRDIHRTVAHVGNLAVSMEHELFACWWRPQHRDTDGTPVELSVEGAPSGDVTISDDRRLVASQLEATARYFSMPGNNLCQGPYQLHDVVLDTLALLRWPAIAAALVLVLHWTLLAVTAFNFSQQADQLDAAAESVYRETFPEARKVVNARSQMKSQLNALESQRGDAGLLPLLAPISAAYQGQSAVTVTQLVFQSQSASVRLAVDARNYAVIDAFSSELQKENLAVSRGTFRQNGEQISGQLIISKGAG